MRTKERSERNKKNRIAILLLLLAFIIILGASVAYFSDFVTGAITGTTGTLDLEVGTITITRHYTVKGASGDEEKTDVYTYNVGDTIPTITNLNPGDILEVSYPVTNAGNKSAWIKDLVTLTVGENYEGVEPKTEAFEIYAGAATNADIRTNTPAVKATALSIGTNATNVMNYESGNTIINGTGTGAEVEGTGVNNKTATYKLYFNSSATNKYQQTDINFTMKTQAIQYRNNTAASWADLVTTEFSL